MGVIVASLRFFRRILCTFLPTGVAVSDFIEESVIVLVEPLTGRVFKTCYLGLMGRLATEFTICFLCRLDGRNMFPIFSLKDLPALPLVLPV